MSYTQYKWKKGDRITSERLNNIETGIVEAKGANGTEPSNDNSSDSNEYIITADITIPNGDASNATYSNLQVPFSTEEFVHDILNANLKLKINMYVTSQGSDPILAFNIEMFSPFIVFDENGDIVNLVFSTAYIIDVPQIFSVILYIESDEFKIDINHKLLSVVKG